MKTIKTTITTFMLTLLALGFLGTSTLKAQNIDTNYWYRLTTMWQGEGKALDVINDGKNNRIQLAKKGNYSRQYWKFTSLGNGWYRLTTMWLKDGKSLDVINDGKNNQIQMANTGNYSGQFWKIQPQGNGYYRLTTMWQGEGKSLDIRNDGKNNHPWLAKTGNYSGQFWKLTKIKPLPNSTLSNTTFNEEITNEQAETNTGKAKSGGKNPKNQPTGVRTNGNVIDDFFNSIF